MLMDAAGRGGGGGAEPQITQPDGSKEDRLKDEVEEDDGAQLVSDSRHEFSFSCFIKHGGRMDIHHCSILDAIYLSSTADEQLKNWLVLPNRTRLPHLSI